MEKVMQKIAVCQEALVTLADAVQLFYEYEQLHISQPTKKNEALFLSTRDSMIQRFEYCIDLFWKTIRIYLEDVEKVDITLNSPRGILRQATHARLLSDQEGMECMDMVESRNKTSHIYHKEVAEIIAQHIPDYYQLMKTVIDRIALALESNHAK